MQNQLKLRLIIILINRNFILKIRKEKKTI